MKLHATTFISYGNFNGFYFDTLEEFQEKYNLFYTLTGCGEYDIQFVDGTDQELFLFRAICDGRLGKLGVLFDAVGDDYSDSDLAKIDFLSGCGYSFHDSLDKLDDVTLYEGKARDWVNEHIEECYRELPEISRQYFDYDSFLYNLGCRGEVVEFKFLGKIYTVTP